MDNMLEVRWHGRGGQGSKTASILLAKIASATGKYIQAFPEYGPERMGAPVLAYTRISDSPIHLHCQVESPDIIVVLDPTLIGTVDITENIKKKGKIIINSSKDPQQVKKEREIETDNISFYIVDADKISREEIGKRFPNTPMLGAFNRITAIMDKKVFEEQARKEFEKKFTGRPELVEGNINSVLRAFQEVKGI